jgi:hypothetical protein
VASAIPGFPHHPVIEGFQEILAPPFQLNLEHWHELSIERAIPCDPVK